MGIEDHKKLEEKGSEFRRARGVLERLSETPDVAQHVKDVMKLVRVSKKYKGEAFDVEVLSKGFSGYLKVMRTVEDAAAQSIGSKRGQSFVRGLKMKTGPFLLELSRARTCREHFTDDELALLAAVQRNATAFSRGDGGGCDVTVPVDELNPDHAIPVLAIDADLQCEQLWSRAKSKTAKKSGFYRTDYLETATTHLKREMFFHAKAFVSSQIYPIFVFDGKAPPEKAAKYRKYAKRDERLEERIAKCNKQIADCVELGIPVSDHIAEEKRKLFMQAERIPRGVKGEIRTLLKSMGLPVVQADGEADPFCVFLERIGVVDGVYTTDSDVLVHGARHRFKTFSAQFVEEDAARGITPHMQAVLSGTSREKLLEITDLSTEQYRDVCILAGCDYNDKIPKYAMVSAYKDMLQLGSLERILEERFAGADTACLNVDACRRLFDRKEYKLDPDELYVSSTVLETSGVQHLADLGFAQQAATLSLDIAVLEDRAKHIVVPERFLSNEAS